MSTILAKLRSFSKATSGYSLVELAVATALTAVLGSITVLIATQVTDVTLSISERSAVQVSSRSLLDQTLRNMRNARPPGACANPSDAESINDCYRIGESKTLPAVLYAGPEDFCFFSYVAASTPESDVLTPPQKTCLGKRPAALGETEVDLLLRVWEPSEVSDYITAWTTSNSSPGILPASDGTTDIVIGMVPAEQEIFTYYDKFGAVIPGPISAQYCTTHPVDREENQSCMLEKISRVEVRMTFTSEEFRNDTDQEFYTSVSLRGLRYAAEQEWGGALG